MSRDPAASDPGPVTPAVVVAGGQALVRAARRSVLERAGLVVCADLEQAPRAAEAAELHDARLVLLDSEIAGGLIAAVRRITDRSPGTVVVVAAATLDEEALLAAVRAGAAGFVLETFGADSLVRAVELALDGDSVFPRTGFAALVEQVRGATRDHTSVDGQPLKLTRREADVMSRRREGMTPKEIAHELDLSDVTVRRHLSSVAKKARRARQARPLTLALD